MNVRTGKEDVEEEEQEEREQIMHTDWKKLAHEAVRTQVDG